MSILKKKEKKKSNTKIRLFTIFFLSKFVLIYSNYEFSSRQIHCKNFLKTISMYLHKVASCLTLKRAVLCRRQIFQNFSRI